MVLTNDDKTLYIASSDSDTVEVFDTINKRITQSIRLTPREDPGFGQIPTSLALSDDEKTLLVACGGENAVAVVKVGKSFGMRGYLPTGWFPIALAQHGGRVYIASSKGIGPRILDPKNKSYYVHDSIGTIQFIASSDWRDLPKLSRTVAENNRWGSEQQPRLRRTPVPMPERVGEPSVFKHVVYIIKENQT